MNNLADRPWLLTPAVLNDLLNTIGSNDQLVKGAITDVAREMNLTPEALETRYSDRLKGTWTVKKRGGVAILPITGMISRYDSYLNWIRGGTATEDVARDFTAADENPEIKAIILNFDTPGGDARAIHECAEMIHASKKPVVAYVGGQCASGGYGGLQRVMRSWWTVLLNSDPSAWFLATAQRIPKPSRWYLQTPQKNAWIRHPNPARRTSCRGPMI